MQSTENFKQFFEALKDMIVVGTADGKVLFINKYLQDKLGYTLEEVQKIGVLGLNPKNKQKEATKIFKEMLTGRRDYCPLPLEAKNGKLIPAETRMFKGKWDGKDCIFGISKDMTEQQAALQKFQKIFDYNPMPMAISNVVDRKFIDVNQAFLDLFGYSEHEIIGKTSEQLGIFTNQQEQIEVANELKTTGEIKNRELTCRTKDGRILIGLFFGEIIDIQDQKAFLTTMVNITTMKENEKELERLNNMMIGREMKMLELKEKIDLLEHKKK